MKYAASKVACLLARRAPSAATEAEAGAATAAHWRIFLSAFFSERLQALLFSARLFSSQCGGSPTRFVNLALT